jgi:arginase
MTSASSSGKTLRLLMPRWQGGNATPHYFGAKMLARLAPETTRPVEEVSVTPPVDLLSDASLRQERGLTARSALLEHLCSAKSIIRRHAPNRIVTLGGDCLVSLAPFAYLKERYEGELAVLWIDAQPGLYTHQPC